MSLKTLKEEIRKTLNQYRDHYDELQGLGVYRFDEKLIDQIIDRTATHVLSQAREVLEGVKPKDADMFTRTWKAGYFTAIKDAQLAIKLIK